MSLDEHDFPNWFRCVKPHIDLYVHIACNAYRMLHVCTFVHTMYICNHCCVLLSLQIFSFYSILFLYNIISFVGYDLSLQISKKKITRQADN